MSIGDRIKERRKQLGLSAEEIAERTGKSPATIYRYENGDIKTVDSSIIELLADALSTTPSYLMGWADPISLFAAGDGIPRNLTVSLERLPPNVRPISQLHHQRVPMIGEVAAGEPIYAPEEQGVYVESAVDADAAITVRGDSMVPTYLDGDVVYIKCRPDVPEGAVAVVFLDDEATIKHVYKRPTGLTLWSDNPSYTPLQIEFADYNIVRIFGVPVGYTRIYKSEIAGKVRKGF